MVYNVETTGELVVERQSTGILVFSTLQDCWTLAGKIRDKLPNFLSNIDVDLVSHSFFPVSD